MKIDRFIRDMETAGALPEALSSTLADYHSHEDYAPIKTWDEVAGYAAKTKSSIQNSEEETSVDYVLSMGFVNKFISLHSIPILKDKETKNHTIFYPESCPWSEGHTTEKNDTECFISIDKRNGMINYRCNHAHCDGKRWKDYKKFYESRDGTKTDQDTRAAPKQFDIKLVAGRDLQDMELPPIVYPISNMIPQGYTVASAPFKYGKSWLALEMCLAVAEGIEFLGQPTTKGAAIYFALEDCRQFAKERLNIALNNRKAPENFYYIMEDVPTLDDGLLDYLNQLYNKIGNIKLVVIDILAKVEYQPKRGESAYKCDYRTGGALKKWADEHLTSLIAITHTTKLVHPNDIFMNTTGTSGVSGAADALITIAKEKRTDKEALLAITGRRVREKYHKVHLKDGYLWETEGEVDPQTMQADQAQQDQEARLEEYHASEIRNAVMAIANAGIKSELTSMEVLEKARDFDIYLLNNPKEVGGFICKFQNYFFKEDMIRVYVRKRGTASNTYKFVLWRSPEEQDEMPFQMC